LTDAVKLDEEYTVTIEDIGASGVDRQIKRFCVFVKDAKRARNLISDKVYKPNFAFGDRID